MPSFSRCQEQIFYSATPVLYYVSRCPSSLPPAGSSMTRTSLPEQSKIAKIIPIFKGGDKLPISLLPNFFKIFEKVMSNRLTFFLESNKLLCEQQFGFRKSHSTLHPLVHFLNKISEAKNKNKHTIAIFCDLRKAFDTADHQILLKKLLI